MDFWSRLIRGRPTQRPLSPTSLHKKRLEKIKEFHTDIKDAVLYERNILVDDPTKLDEWCDSIRQINLLLISEQRTPAHRVCLSYVLSESVFTDVARLVSYFLEENLVTEAIGFFATLVDNDEDIFISTRHFARALIECVDSTGSTRGQISVSELTAGSIVELLFAVAARVRLQSQLIDVWFIGQASPALDDGDSGKDDATIGSNSKASSSYSRHENFPLCYQLVHYIHHDGPIGEFARTGLLYIFESASRSKALESWLIESDLPTLLASGLGALYSQLNRKLSIAHPVSEDMPIVLLLSDYDEGNSFAESFYSTSFHKHAAAFLSYLTLWQDFLENSKSDGVKESLIEHFRVLFLEQLLYPAILQSSDLDGGSSVAVLTYLRQIIETITHPELTRLILIYLLAIVEPSKLVPGLPTYPQIKKNRRSFFRLEKLDSDLETGQGTAGPSIFSLSDLILNSIRSQSPQTVNSALRLIHTIVSNTHEYTVGTLYRCYEAPLTRAQRTIGGLNAEVQEYIQLASSFGSEEGWWEDPYECYKNDAYISLERHCCFANQEQHLAGSGHYEKVHLHTLEPNDALIKTLFQMLDNFLANDVEVNLSLTQTLVSLASCRSLLLDGWAAVAGEHYEFNDDVEDAYPSQTVGQIQEARRIPTWKQEHSPLLMQSIGRILAQVDTLCATNPNFKNLVTSRRKTFQLYDNLQNSDTREYQNLLNPLGEAPVLTSRKFTAPNSSTQAGPTTPVQRTFGSSANEPSVASIDQLPTSPVTWISQRVREAFDGSQSSSSLPPTPGHYASQSTPSIDTNYDSSTRVGGTASGTPNQMNVIRSAFRNIADSMTSLKLNPFDDSDLVSPQRASASSSNHLENLKLGQTEYVRPADSGKLPFKLSDSPAPGLGIQKSRESAAIAKQNLVSNLVNLATRNLRGRSFTFPLRQSPYDIQASEAKANPQKISKVPDSPTLAPLSKSKSNAIQPPTAQPEPAKFDIGGTNSEEAYAASSDSDEERAVEQSIQDENNSKEEETKPKESDTPAPPDGSIAAGTSNSLDTAPREDPNWESDKESLKTKVDSEKVVSLNHILTNVIILQDFIVEIVTILQARANLFEEVMLISPDKGIQAED